jgi:hypothetical protein
MGDGCRSTNHFARWCRFLVEAAWAMPTGSRLARTLARPKGMRPLYRTNVQLSMGRTVHALHRRPRVIEFGEKGARRPVMASPQPSPDSRARSGEGAGHTLPICASAARRRKWLGELQPPCGEGRPSCRLVASWTSPRIFDRMRNGWACTNHFGDWSWCLVAPGWAMWA